jgi:hypothetical protein
MAAASTDAVFVAVDTHADAHHVVVVDQLGRHLGDREFPAIRTATATSWTGFPPPPRHVRRYRIRVAHYSRNGARRVRASEQSTLEVAMTANRFGRWRRRSIIAVLLPVASLFVACGDQSGDSGPSITPASSTETAVSPAPRPTTRHSFPVGTQPTPPPTNGVGPTMAPPPTQVGPAPGSEIPTSLLPSPTTPTTIPVMPSE